MRASTPKQITDRIARFMARVSSDQQPVRIAVTPLPDSTLDSCFPTVMAHVERHGGEMVVGWQITEIPGVMLEAIFHGVWCDSYGELHDLTLKQDWITEVLFLPDPRKKYEGHQVGSIREALVDSRAVRDLLAAKTALFEFSNRGERRYQHELLLTRAEDIELGKLIAAVDMALMTVERGIGSPLPPTASDQCPCGSRRLFADCHGRL